MQLRAPRRQDVCCNRRAGSAGLALLATLVASAAGRAQSTGFGQPHYIAGSYPFTEQAPPVFINDVVGARIFYDRGIFGDSTVIANVEAGHIWDGHEVFDRSGLGLGPAVERYVTGSGGTGALDFHATMVGHVLGGTGYDPVTASYSYVGLGMAPRARLWSGAIATAFATDPENIGGFETTAESTIPVYRQFFRGVSGTSPDVINSSWGGPDAAAITIQAQSIDALAFENPGVLFVATAGNDATAPVSAPGNVYNGITVGSVGGTQFLTPSSFSSRGAVDFYNPATDTTIAGVRAAVDIAAPGESGFLAAYLGPTGGLAPLPSVTQDPSPTGLYFTDVDGTSFASPTVAGGVALMKDAAKGRWWLVPETAFDSRVVKSVLMATAVETDGWNNGQVAVGGVVRTTQSLDYATGAGALDLTSAGLTYVAAPTMDVAGSGGGTIGTNGWDLGSVTVGGTNDYSFTATLAAPSRLTVALDWFTNGVFVDATDTGSRTAFANLDLQVWSIVDGAFSTLVAESVSTYNNAEMLRLDLSPGGLYGLRVTLPQMVYDLGATPVTAETYGLSWTVMAVPEPSACLVAVVGLTLAAVRSCRLGQRTRSGGGIGRQVDIRSVRRA
jgi:hypothetical protein